MTKLTKQGVRDLGGNTRVRAPQPIAACPHIWEAERVYDCWAQTWSQARRCGLCQEIRSDA